MHALPPPAPVAAAPAAARPRRARPVVRWPVVRWPVVRWPAVTWSVVTWSVVASSVGVGLVGGLVWAAPVAAARTPDRPAGATVYRPPLDGHVRVLRPFDPPPRPWLAGHRGVDLATADGRTVRAPAGGVVTFAGVVVGRGVVSVLHDDGRRSSVEPVTSTVVAGTRVAAGDPLGTVAGGAHGGVLDAPALHWGVREGDTYVDPWALLPDQGPVVLLPVP